MPWIFSVWQKKTHKEVTVSIPNRKERWIYGWELLYYMKRALIKEHQVKVLVLPDAIHLNVFLYWVKLYTQWNTQISNVAFNEFWKAHVPQEPTPKDTGHFIILKSPLLPSFSCSSYLGSNCSNFYHHRILTWTSYIGNQLVIIFFLIYLLALSIAFWRFVHIYWFLFIIPSFSLCSSISLYQYTTICLAIFLLIDISVVSSFGPIYCYLIHSFLNRALVFKYRVWQK